MSDSSNNVTKNLQDAHTLMCERVLGILQNDEATVQELKLAAEWLKQNRVEALAVPGSPMGRVAEAAAVCRHEVTGYTNLASPSPAAPPIQFPSFPAGDILDDDDPVVIDPPKVVLGDGRQLG